MSVRKVLVVVAVLALIGAFFALDLDRYLTLENLQASRERLVANVHETPLTASAVFFGIYVAVCALSLPGAALMTLAAGAIFGTVWGLVLVSFASSLGATLAFVIARSVLGDWVRRRFETQLEVVDRGIERDGNFYLFTLRMVPVFPFFLINLLMALTRIGVVPFYLVSQLGMLAGTFVYVFAGTQLAEVHSLGDVLSPGLIAALSALGLFPLVARKLVAWLSRRRAVAP